ncbi:MAG: DUF1700 domain-containing protein [Ruminococcaceae bacterium]|nr:DUF1700 domain-containing protein [Oscillospiraceae bacterium]
MNKIEFLENLRSALSGLPQDEIDERLSFYGEMIDDRIEDGLTEEGAVLQIGSVDDIVSQTVADIPLAKLVKEKVKPNRKLRAWEIVLLAVGFPIWISLLIALIAVVISIYVSLWSVIISLWAAFGSIVGGGAGAIASGVIFICTDNVIAGIAMIGAGFVLAGLSIFFFFGCKAATKGIIILTKKIAVGIKNCFIKKEEA